MSHGDSRFRCRKGGSAGGGRGEEARLFTRLKRAWGCIPRLPETCLSLPPVEALYERQRYTERWAGSWGVLLEPQGNQRDTPQKHPKAALKPTTHTHQHIQTPSDTTVKPLRLNCLHNSASTDRTQYTPKCVGTHVQPQGTRTDPTAAHTLQTSSTRAHTSFTHRHTDTHTAKSRETGRPQQPTTCAHTLPADTKNTDNPRKGPRACTSSPGHTPSPSSDPPTGESPNIAAASRRERVGGTGTTPHTLPPARGSGEDTPA